ARRRGLRWEKNGWWIPADDCVRLKGWDPWAEPTGTSGNKDDGDRPIGEWRASAHDARGWTEKATREWPGGRTKDARDVLAYGSNARATSGKDATHARHA
ncbi:Unknown protein, partial [Striga hermonthica]